MPEGPGALSGNVKLGVKRPRPSLEFHERRAEAFHRPSPQKRPTTWGERHFRAKLTEEKVREIRAIRETVRTETYEQIAKRYGVERSVIWAVLTRRTWAHVQ
jgi:membrane-bound lytic murein transglycosylase B